MTTIQIIGAIALIIASVLVIGTVVLQESKGGLGALGGANESQLDKTRGRTNEAALSAITKFAGIALFVVTLIVLLISK